MPPPPAKLVRIGSIRQEELEAIVAIDCQICELLRLREKRCGPVLDRLIEGVPVEPGAHSAELDLDAGGATRLVHLVINGRRIQ